MNNGTHKSVNAGGREDEAATPLDPNGDIGTKLKAFYSSVQDEPVPDRFLDLLERLDESERRGGKSTDF